MAKPIEALSIQLKFKDAGSQAVIEKVKGSLKRLQIAASGAKPNIKGLRDEILAQGRASIKSVSNINAQRTALMALRDEAKIGGNTFKQLTADIKKLDAQLGKTSKKSGGMGARRATQTAGAIISGGIFGGPEGAIGGALGAFGGVEGAFAGAAIGAQVGMLRQAVGEMANYAASIEKAKIALNGILPEQNDYNFALQIASQATKELNVPQEQSIRGITRLSAAVTGAGGPVQDAATTFRNVTAAIKATGGSSEDVQGAITAMVQVFSKGKVSAEELSGQLGERLPGAVTLFAKANEMTLPELQKNLKAGTVGLNELMNFIVELGNKYNTTAEKISGSNAEAGAKLSVAIQDMQASIGAALIPIGAQFQAAFAEFIREITPFLATNLPKLGRLFLALAKNLDTLAIAAAAALGVFGVAKLVAVAKAVGSVTAAVTVLKGALVAMGLANPFTALAVAAGVLAGKIYNASKEQDRFNKLVKEGTVAQVDAELQQKMKERDELIARRLQFGQGTSAMARSFQEGGAEYLREQALNTQISQLRERRRTAAYDASQGADLDLSLLPRFKYESVKPDGSGAGAKDISKAEADARIRGFDLRNKMLEITEKDIRAQADLVRKAAEVLPPQKRRVRLAEIQLKEDNAIFRLQEKTRKDLEKQADVQAKLQQSLQDRQYKLGLITEQEYIRLQIERERRRLEKEGASDEMIEKTLAVYRQQLDPDFFTSINKELAEMRRNFEKLISPANQVIGAANAIGDAFGNSFKQVITGQASARQALANFFQSVASHFADMASQIIAEAIKMQAVKFISQIISAFVPTGGGGTGFGGASSNSALSSALPSTSSLADAAASTPLNLNAGGNYLSGGFKAFQAGGVVSQPTLGMVGEGGEPEYIIPQSKMRESMARYSRGVRGPGVIPDNGVASMSEGSGVGVATPIDVRFSVERINNIDYVTATEFQQGLQQAAAQGAQRGEQNTLKRLQMSGSTRRRLGM